jgi:hypothetical protein
MTSSKLQISSNYQFSSFTFKIWNLAIGIYLGFAKLRLGPGKAGEFEIWKLFEILILKKYETKIKGLATKRT